MALFLLWSLQLLQQENKARNPFIKMSLYLIPDPGSKQSLPRMNPCPCIPSYVFLCDSVILWFYDVALPSMQGPRCGGGAWDSGLFLPAWDGTQAFLGLRGLTAARWNMDTALWCTATSAALPRLSYVMCLSVAQMDWPQAEENMQ